MGIVVLRFISEENLYISLKKPLLVLNGLPRIMETLLVLSGGERGGREGEGDGGGEGEDDLVGITCRRQQGRREILRGLNPAHKALLSFVLLQSCLLCTLL